MRDEAHLTVCRGFDTPERRVPPRFMIQENTGKINEEFVARQVIEGSPSVIILQLLGEVGDRTCGAVWYRLFRATDESWL